MAADSTPADSPAPVPAERIPSRIVVLRGQGAILTADLAALYGVPTKRLNEQVKRNARHFPEDVCLQFTREEPETLQRSRSQFATLNRGQSIQHLPRASTKHGDEPAIRQLAAFDAGPRHRRKIGFHPGNR